MYNLVMANGSENNFQIIIVDDDDFLVDMYAAKFGNDGISVEVCKLGESFLEMLRSGVKADLVLLDIVMPGKDGLTVLKEMREQKLGEEIPVVILTNQGDKENISAAKKLGIAGYIVKSAVAPSEVVEEVKRIIKKSK